MSVKRVLLKQFFKTIPPRSGIPPCTQICFWFLILGRLYPVFQGTKRGCYQAYRAHCERARATDRAIVKTPRVFHLHRRLANIGVQKAYVLLMFPFQDLHLVIPTLLSSWSDKSICWLKSLLWRVNKCWAKMTKRLCKNFTMSLLRSRSFWTRPSNNETQYWLKLVRNTCSIIFHAY